MDTPAADRSNSPLPNSLAVVLVVVVAPIPVVSLPLVRVQLGELAILIVSLVEPLAIIGILVGSPNVVIAVVWIIHAIIMRVSAPGGDHRRTERTQAAFG